MKSYLLAHSFFASILFIACGPKKVQLYNVDVTLADGSKQSYAMHEGSMLLVHDGEVHTVTKVVNGNEHELELQVTRYTVTHDSIKGENTISKTVANTNKITKGTPVALDPSGTAKVSLQTTTMGGERQGTTVGCNGVCCEATCFSVYCCGDNGACKDTPCDCKGPSNCPGTQTALAAQYFEVFRSGKDMMVFKI